MTKLLHELLFRVSVEDPEKRLDADQAGYGRRCVVAIGDIIAERQRQVIKWGPQHHRDGTSVIYRRDADYWRAINDNQPAERVSWANILREEVHEALSEEDTAKLRKELVQVAAVASAWVEDIDSRG